MNEIATRLNASFWFSVFTDSDAVVSSGVTQLHLDQQSLEGLPDHLLNNPSFPSLTMLSLCKARISPTSLGRLSELLQGPGGLTELCLSGLKLSETQALAQLLEPGEGIARLIFSLILKGIYIDKKYDNKKISKNVLCNNFDKLDWALQALLM